MNWKTYRDALMFDEEVDEGEDEENGGTPDPETEEESTDIDKLRSTYDSKLAEMEKELKKFREDSSKSTTQSQAQTAYNTALQEVYGLVNKAKTETDKAKALDTLLEALNGFAPRYGQFVSGYTTSQLSLREAQAERFAMQLQHENGGTVEAYKARLLDGNPNQDQMKYRFLEIQVEGQSNKKRKPKDAQPTGKIDRGSGGAARTNVLREMEDIDLSTPEGQAEWKAKSPGFRRKLEPATR